MTMHTSFPEKFQTLVPATFGRIKPQDIDCSTSGMRCMPLLLCRCVHACTHAHMHASMHFLSCCACMHVWCRCAPMRADARPCACVCTRARGRTRACGRKNVRAYVIHVDPGTRVPTSSPGAVWRGRGRTTAFLLRKRALRPNPACVSGPTPPAPPNPSTADPSAPDTADTATAAASSASKSKSSSSEVSAVAGASPGAACGRAVRTHACQVTPSTLYYYSITTTTITITTTTTTTPYHARTH